MNAASIPVPPLVAENVTVKFDGTTILDSVSFTAGPGCLMGVVGPNGAGKSTLFNALVGLVKVNEGRILIYGESIHASRGIVAYVPQYEKINSRMPMKSEEVVMMGRSRRIGWFRRPGRDDREAVRHALEQVGMWERRSAQVSDLSGRGSVSAFSLQGRWRRARTSCCWTKHSAALTSPRRNPLSGYCTNLGTRDGLSFCLRTILTMLRTIATSACASITMCAPAARRGTSSPLKFWKSCTVPTAPRLYTEEFRMDIISEAFVTPFEYSFMVRALIVSVIVGIMCPVVGAYVVTRGLGFMGDALAHAALPGMALAFMLGLSPFIGIIPGAIAIALLIGYMTMRAGVSEDTSIGILFAGLFAPRSSHADDRRGTPRERGRCSPGAGSGPHLEATR